MKPVFQTRFGVHGNCLAACVASILEVERAAISVANFVQSFRSEVPHRHNDREVLVKQAQRAVA